MSQSVTIPTGLSFSIMMMLPIFSSFIFFAMSCIVSFGDAETTGLFMMSLTSTLVVISASVCSLTGFFTTKIFEYMPLITYLTSARRRSCYLNVQYANHCIRLSLSFFLLSELTTTSLLRNSRSLSFDMLSDLTTLPYPFLFFTLFDVMVPPIVCRLILQSLMVVE